MNETKVTAQPGTHEILITREFDAPRDLVFKVYTDPEMMLRWLGPRNMKMEIDTVEVKPGGFWRYIHHDEEGNAYGFRGVYHDVTAPDRVIGTFEFEGMPGHVSLETATFEDRGDKTLVTVKSVFQSVEDRDGMIQSGMEGGLRESYERLDELLAEALSGARS
jgi:uncharacterized protein YndB with AHSA1/START domain